MSFEGYFGYDPGRANYLTHVSLRHKAVFVEVPKAGCTTVKKVMQFSEVSGDVSKLSSDVHARRESPLVDMLAARMNPDEVFGRESAYFRFAFIRNPFTRIISCYKDKIIGSQWERDLRLPQLGFSPTDEVSLEAFLERVLVQDPTEMDIHWAPQTLLLASDRIRYSYIGRQETFAIDMQRVVDRVGFDVPPSGVSTLPPHATRARDGLAGLSGEATQLIRRIYRDDFARLGYGLDPTMA